MPAAAIMKQSNIIRVLLVVMTISSSSTAAIYSATSNLDSAVWDIYALKPSDIIFPGFVQPDLRLRPEGYRGFSGFVREVRGAVQSTGGAPRTQQAQVRSFRESSAGSQTPDATYETSIPIRLGKDSGTGNTAEVFLGFSVKQVLNEIPATGTIAGERPANNVGKNRQQATGLSGASVRGGSLSRRGNWLGGGFLATGDSVWISGFGFDLRPLSYPTYPGNGPYFNPDSPDA